jgi:cysteine desulfurase
MSVYLDHAATTPIRPEILQNYLEQLQVIGNPSSVHGAGQKARRNVEDARDKLASAVDCHRSEVLFTSGGTESDNLAIKGLYLSRNLENPECNIIITAGTEHHAGLDQVECLDSNEGAEAIWAKLDHRGVIDLDWLEQFLKENGTKVALISLMWVNNETGLINPIKEISALAAQHGIPVHTDAVAAFGHVPLSFKDSGVTTMAISGHKIGAPVGIGALIVARNAKLAVTSHGGGQERGIRSGTLSAPLATIFADAAALAVEELAELTARLEPFKNKIIAVVNESAPNAVLSRGDAPGFVGIIHFTFPGCNGDSLLFLLDSAGVAVSTGSACRAGVTEASHVLMAMGRTQEQARGSLRISLGYTTTMADVDAFIEAFPAAYQGALKAGLPSK